jgi:hypothetical protein
MRCRAVTIFSIAALLFQLATPAFGATDKSASSSERILIAAQHGEIDILRAKKTPHPRSFAGVDEWDSIRRALLEGDRSEAFQKFLSGLSPLLRSGELEPVPSIVGSKADEGRILELATKQNTERATRGAQGLAFAALVTGRTDYIEGAKRHLLALADLDPHGPTGISQGDLAARHVAWTLALGLDWLYPHWTSAERGRLVGAITPRMEDFAQRWVRGPQPLEMQPIDSHANEILGAFAEIGVLLAGETPLADRWMKEFIPLYARLLTPFGGDDGGYANGTSYAFVDISEYSLRHWDTLRRAIGLDLTLKSWARNFGKYLTYFLPPGTPVGSFGDAAEQNSAQGWALTAKAFAARVPLPLNRWYARQWFQEDKQSIDMLLAPLTENSQLELPGSTPNAAHFPTIGWVAMHSDLRDRGRTSIYFKSSPYGAASHGHYDQNSFVLNTQGKPLLIDSGYYDLYGSKHHFGWSIRTKAHNAITVDGGSGQENEQLLGRDSDAVGRITQFESDGQVDMVVGDASESYRGLAQARRGLVFDRNGGWIIVMDRLASLKPHSWEWNIHALEPFRLHEGGDVEVRNGDVRACIEFKSSKATSFAQHDKFGFEPLRASRNSYPAQWHGAFRTEMSSARFDSVALIYLGCKSTLKPSVYFEKNATVIRIDSFQFRFENGQIKRTNVDL